jgi:Protein of unknown function (DUF4238)
MGKRREHHFVPKFYLKNFSIRQEKVIIRLYDTQSNFYFEKASISDQAKEKYLYGEDDVVESKLGVIEGEAAAVIKSIINSDRLPKGKEHFQLLKFILYQHTRTTKREKVIKESFNELMKGTFGETRPQSSISVKEMVEMVESQLPYLGYTGCKLIVNDTKIPFITSDNPVVLYSQLMENKKDFARAAWASKGLQVFFPISPDHLIFLYDIFTYSVGKYRNSSEVNKISEKDVVQLNALQYLNCKSLLYFDENIEKADIEKVIAQFKKEREKLMKPKLMSFGSYRWVMIHEPRINLNLSFSKLSMTGKRFTPMMLP